MQGTVFTIVRFKIVSTITNFVDVFFMIARYDAVVNYMFFSDSTGEVLDCNMGKCQELHTIIVFLTGAR